MSLIDRLGKGDWQRIAALPTREGLPAEARELAESLRTPEGTWTLSDAQAQVLWDLRTEGSAIGLVTVGGGKTLIASLAATVTGLEGRTALLVPPDLAKAFDAEYAKYEPEFRVSRPTLLRYSMLSREEGVGMLRAHDPDLLILDEAHYVRRRESARTKRLLRFLRERREAGRPVRVVALSGTLIRSSVMDLALFFDEVLGKESSPFPKAYSTRRHWARVIDPPARPDELPDALDYMNVRRLCEWAGQRVCVAGAREAFKTRLTTAPGVTCTSGSSCDASITIRQRKIKHPAKEAAALLASDWALPCGYEEIEASQVAAQAKRLAWGYYYRWAWGEDGPDYEWLEARSRYYSASRDCLGRSWEGIDTQGLLEKRGDAGVLPEGVVAQRWYRARIEWLEIGKAQPPTEIVWIDQEPLRKALRSAPKRSLVWYSDKAQESIARQVAAETGADFYAPGSVIDLEALANSDRPFFVSANSHQKGWNLQARSRMIVLSPTSGAAKWEQLLGRVHRQGQAADTVEVDVFIQGVLKKSLDKARIGARFLHESGGGAQKLDLATLL